MHIMCIGGAFMKKKKFAIIIAIICCIFSVVAVVIVVVFDSRFAYQLEIYAKNFAVNRINVDVNSAVLTQLQNSDITYAEFITAEKDEQGSISAISSDMVKINLLKNNLDKTISELCQSDSQYEAKIPIGNLIGGSIFYGRGFKITVKFRPIGEVNTRMTGELVEAGINQTIYRISFDINVNVAIVFPFRYVEVPVKVQTVIAETIIVGDVPESFTYFRIDGNVDGEDMMGYVQDFKA